MAIDKMKWHFEVPDFPRELASEQGGVHIAFFFRWMLENGFAGEEIVEEYPTIKEDSAEGIVDAFEVFVTFLDGNLLDEDFTEAGARFANAYYLEKELYAKEYGNYLEDYEAVLKELEHYQGYEKMYQGIIYSESNYAIIKKILDERYEQFQAWLKAGNE